MNILTWEISLTKEQLGYEKLTPPASVTGYLLDPVSLSATKRRPAVIICPGGGYGHLSDREGEPVAMQLAAMGIHTFILKYSLAPDVFPASLMELAETVSEIRAHADSWMVDPDRILVCGFSAGGHLACSLGAFWNREFLWKPLNKKADEIRPDGMILCYPVITSGADCHQGSFQNLLGTHANDENLRRLVSLEHQVGSHTPKTFLWHTASDSNVPVANSLLLAEALTRHQVSLELHIYPVGCHGLSLATEEVSSSDGRYVEPQCQSWISLLKTWLEHF